jgi:hypothetical protein
LIERELPAGHLAVCGRLGRREVAVIVDDEHAWIRCDGLGIEVAGNANAPVATARLGRAVVSDLLKARLSVLDALLAGRFELVGATGDLIPLHDALIAYFASAARCPSFPELLYDFLEGA